MVIIFMVTDKTTRDNKGMMNMSELEPIPELAEFIEACVEYNKHHKVDMSKFETCPVDAYGIILKLPCLTVYSGVKNCPLCGLAMCPVCGRHNVTQLSRVTGYMSSVQGWNEAKKQELKDRKRYDIGKVIQ